MRKNLINLEGKRISLTGVFEKYSTKRTYKGIETTILLTNIKNLNNKLITTHVWLPENGFKPGTLEMGDVIEFDAVVTMYFKPNGHDYTLTNPRNIKLIG